MSSGHPSPHSSFWCNYDKIHNYSATFLYSNHGLRIPPLEVRWPFSLRFLDFGSFEAQHSPAQCVFMGPSSPFQCYVQTFLQLHGVRAWWHPPPGTVRCCSPSSWQGGGGRSRGIVVVGWGDASKTHHWGYS